MKDSAERVEIYERPSQDDGLEGTRRSPRRRTLASVRILDGPDLGSELRATDVSADGAFIRSGASLAAGRRLRIELQLPTDRRPISGIARVVRASPAGMGVRFEELSARDRARLRAHAGFYEMDDAVVRLQQGLKDLLPGNLLPLGDANEIEFVLRSAIEQSLEVTVVLPRKGAERSPARLTAIRNLADYEHVGPTLHLEMIEGRLDGDAQVVYLTFSDPPLHYAMEGIVLAAGSRPVVMMPERVYLNERRTESRSGRKEAWCELEAPHLRGGKVRLRVLDYGRRGAALRVGADALLLPGARLPGFTLMTDDGPRPIAGATVRYLVVEGEDKVRVGLHFDSGEEERDSFQDLKQRSTTTGFRATLSRSLSYFGGKVAGFLRRPERRYAGGVEVVRFRNRRGDMVAAIVDANFNTSDIDQVPDVAIVVAPAILKRKEVFGLLARTIIDDLSQDGRKVVTLRFDASYVVGESTMDPRLEAEGRPYYNWTFDHLAADMEASLRYLQWRFRPRQRVLVSVSLSAIPARKVILGTESPPVDYWIAPYGCPDAQDMIRNYLAGLDLFPAYAEGVGPETILIHGRPIRGPSLFGHAAESGMAFLEDGRRDLGRIRIPVTWIVGTYDHWVTHSRVKEMLDAPGGGEREIFECATGHVLKTGTEAIELFKLISESISKHVFNADRPAKEPNMARFARQSEAEWARVKRLRVEDKERFWQEHLFGGPDREIGYDIMLDHPDYPRFLADQVELLDLRPGDDLADFGCGTGNLTVAMLDAYRDDAPPASLSFLDIVPQALERTEGKLVEHCRRKGRELPALRPIAADLEVSRLSAVDDFVNGRLYHVEELVNRVEGFTQHAARKLSDHYGKELHSILRGAPAGAGRVRQLCPDLTDAEIGMVLELGRASRFLVGELLPDDLRPGVEEARTAMDLRFEQLNFGEATTSFQLDLPDACFDRIGCSLVLPYLYDPLSALREIYRLLKPGGVAVISSIRPNFDPSKLYSEAAEIFHRKGGVGSQSERKLEALRHFGNMVSRLIELEEDGRFQFLDERSLGEMVREVGFGGVELSRSFGSPATALVVRAEK